MRSSPRYRVIRMLASAAPGLLAAALVFMIVEALLPNLVLIAMGRTVGDIPAALAPGLGSPAGHRMLLQLVVAGALYAVSLLRGPAEDALNAMVQGRMSVVSRRRLVEAVSAPAGIAHLEDPAVLDRLSSAQGELLNHEPSGAAMTLIGRAGDRLSGVLACAVLATFHWWLGLGVLAMWLVLRRPLRELVRSRVGTFRRATEALRRSWYFGGLAWRPAPAKEVRVFGLGDWLVGNHRSLYAEAMRPSWTEIERLNRRIALLSAAVLAAYATSTATLGWAAYHHTITLGALVVMLTMLPASMQAGSVNATDFALESMLSSVPDLDALTAEPTAEPATGDAPVAEPPRGDITFEAVSFRYPGTGHDVLGGLDLVLEAGRSTAVVGVNGAGKTTLVTLLARLRDPTAGRILVDGVPLADLPARAWQRQVAVVYQDFTRFPLTARENVALDLLGEPVDQETLMRVARRAGAADLMAGLRDGWETVLSAQYEGGQDLSGGQWQRVALARALYAVERGARILVLDEPTAQLDVRAEARFYDRFLEITGGVTSVVISHRFSTVRRADRIAVLDGGRVTELGDHEELVRAGGTYAEMFELQVSRFGPKEERR
ncbi:ABC transporter ATP-binding protein [Actinoallomurus bryophytorum]|uniref:ATP-binding cassette subfamily B protein n=1 Tax=Actinoallomurus bryophytorum TaxID=1490222 RepID=A0A543CRU3_9ACTN|nr:ABC transporter ATP-binding protein [Actinoallomurus bryophytorum]TQL99768.1 ATP-binding cassette subfamily B protein [Actinoallomurus bryophytorum]